LNPHGPFKPCGFSYRLRLSPPLGEALLGDARFAVWTIPSPSSGKIRSLGAARLVSTPSRLEYITGIGSGLPFKVSPNLSSSTSPVSQASTQVFLKSAAYAIPPRPRAAVLLMIGHVSQFYTCVSWSAGSAGTGILHATSVTLPSFDLLFFGRITLIATALSEVLMCDA